MDLLHLSHSETADCIIKDPFTGEDTDLVINFHGPGTKQYKEAAKMILAKKGDEMDSEALSIVTAGWNNFENSGKPFEFTKENARMAYLASIPLRMQAADFIFVIRNFLPKR